MAVAAALVAGRLLGQAPAAPVTAAQPAATLSAPSILPAPSNEPKSGQARPVVPAQVQPAAPAFPAFPEAPVRTRRATNAAPAASASTNFPSALPRAFPRPAAPPAPPVPGGASSASAKPAASGGGGAPATPAGGAAKAGQPSEEDQAINDATLKALRERSGTNQPSDSIVFKDQDLNVFLDQVYGPLVHRTVLRAQGLPQVRISIDTQTTLSEEEEVQMWDTVLALNGITMIPQGEKFVTAVPVAQALQEGARFSNKPSDQYAEASQFVTHVVTLKHVAIEEAVPTITPFAKNANGIVALASTKTLVLRDYAINVKRMLEILSKIDIEVEEDFQLEVIPIKYGKVDEIYATLTSVIGGGGVSGTPGGGVGGVGGMGGMGVGGMAGRRGGIGGMGGMGTGFNNQFGGAGQFGGGVNQLGGAGRFGTGSRLGAQQVAGGAVQPGGAAVNTGTFQNRFNAMGRGGSGPGSGYGGLSDLLQTVSITADTRSNSLIVYGNKKDIAKLREVLTKVDTLLPQVLVEAIIMEVNLSSGWNYGVSAAQRPAQFGDNANNRGGGVVNNPSGAPLGTGSDFLRQLGRSAGGSAGTNVISGIPATSGAGLSYFAQIGQNWDIALSAIAADSRVNVIQRPRVITSHATAGSFFVGSEVPFVSGSFFGGGTFGNSQSITRQQVGVGLNVTPFITPDNLVVMQIDQTVDNLGANLDLGNGLSAPQTQTRSASSFVTVRDKDAVLLGGYITTSTDKQKSGVPLLKDIPYLGAAFSKRSQNSARTELMILIRPSILATPADAGEVADQERQRLPGVRVAEKEFENNEKAEARKAKRQLKE
jgi:general secretion pathway protein D